MLKRCNCYANVGKTTALLQQLHPAPSFAHGNSVWMIGLKPTQEFHYGIRISRHENKQGYAMVQENWPHSKPLFYHDGMGDGALGHL